MANPDGTPYTNGEQRYKPFGEKRYPSGASGLPTTFRYTGQRQETGLGPSGGEGLYFYGARFYDPSLGRFVQADIIVPDPGNPQAFDRYAYALDNPIGLMDPDGYCSTQKPDSACWKRFYSIRNKYPNVYMDGRQWELKELKLIDKSLSLTKKAFGGQKGFIKGLGNISIMKANTPNDTVGMAPAGSDSVFLNPVVFTYSKDMAIFKIIHEIGHTFDFKGTGGHPELYKSQIFVTLYAPGCDTNYFGCVSDTSNYPKIPGETNSGWNPDPLQTTRYGKNASIDDFADSFAAYVMRNGGMTPPEDVSNERRMIIELIIDGSK